MLKQLFVVEISKTNVSKSNQNNNEIFFSFKNGAKVSFATEIFVVSNSDDTNSNSQLLIQINDNESFILNINIFKNIDKKLFAQKDSGDKNSNSQLQFDSVYVTLNIDF